MSLGGAVSLGGLAVGRYLPAATCEALAVALGL